MKSTTPLKVLCQARMPEDRINMHPNEGADLGMMTTSYTVSYDGGQLHVYLLNECGKECVELPAKIWEKMGKPPRLIIEYDGTSIRMNRA
jgi:hypothetical protein